jgi:hypothetical protein
MPGPREYIKPGLWGAFAGAVAMAIVGFWGLGWTTVAGVDRVAKDRTDAAVVAALAPFCVVSANRDTETAKLVIFRALAIFRAEESSYKRTQLVADAGWASMAGTTSPNYALALACSEILKGAKVS